MLEWLISHLKTDFDTQLFKLSDAPVTPLSLLFFVLTILMTFAIASVVRRGILRFFQGKKKTNEGLSYALARIGQYVVVTIGVIFALDNVGIDLGAFAAVGAVVTVGVGFGMQNIAQNFISGLILLIERPVQKGDFIVVGETIGTVLAIEMRATRVVTRDGVAIIVPNSQLITTPVINQSSPTSVKRVAVNVGVAYGSDVELVKSTLLAVGAAHPEALKEPGAQVFFTDFADSALAFVLTLWIAHPKDEPLVTSDLRFAIDRAFREKKIEIPFPQRDVHVRDLPPRAA